jgi:hypothetical protein
MASNEVLMGVEINHRTQQIQVKTMVRGKGRHNTYASLQQAPEAVRGEALVLIREALHRSGYASLVELDTALAAGPVTPAAADETASEAPAKLPKTFKPRGKATLGDEELPLDDEAFEMGGG